MLKFDEKFLYGVKEMDTEHIELINRAETLINAYQQENPEKELLKLLNFLTEYVVLHFDHEEALQRQYAYPAYEEHKYLHDNFKQDVRDLYQDILKNGLTMHSRLKFMHLSSDWIEKHIGEEDKKLADYLKKNGY